MNATADDFRCMYVYCRQAGEAARTELIERESEIEREILLHIVPRTDWRGH